MVDEVVADVSVARIGEGGLRQRDRAPRHVLLGGAGCPGERLDRLAVGIAGGELHAPIDLGRVLAEDALDRAGVLEERQPVDLGEQAQGTHRPLDPGARVEVELEGLGGEVVRLEDVQAGEEVQQAAQHRHPQHGRQRPELGDGERRDVLVGVEIPLERRRVEIDAAPDHERPRQGVDPREALGRARGELREVPKETARKLLVDLPRDAANQVVVVEVPLGRPPEGRVVRVETEEVVLGAIQGVGHRLGLEEPGDRSPGPAERALALGEPPGLRFGGCRFRGLVDGHDPRGVHQRASGE